MAVNEGEWNTIQDASARTVIDYQVNDGKLRVQPTIYAENRFAVWTHSRFDYRNFSFSVYRLKDGSETELTQMPLKEDGNVLSPYDITPPVFVDLPGAGEYRITCRVDVQVLEAEYMKDWIRTPLHVVNFSN